MRALKKVLLTKDSQIYTNEGCSRFFNILHFFDSQAVEFSPRGYFGPFYAIIFSILLRFAAKIA